MSSTTELVGRNYAAFLDLLRQESSEVFNVTSTPFSFCCIDWGHHNKQSASGWSGAPSFVIRLMNKNKSLSTGSLAWLQGHVAPSQFCRQKTWLRERRSCREEKWWKQKSGAHMRHARAHERVKETRQQCHVDHFPGRFSEWLLKRSCVCVFLHACLGVFNR